MNKFMTFMSAISLVLTASPAFADRYRGEYRPDFGEYAHRSEPVYGRYQDRREYRNRDNTGPAIAALVGGVIVGALIASNNRNNEPVCRDVERYDYYGNRYFERVCR